MPRPLTEKDLRTFYDKVVVPHVERLLSLYVNREAVFVDMWDSQQKAPNKTIWDGTSLFYCYKVRVEEGGLVHDEWVEEPIALKTDVIYVDCENDAMYRWNGEEMVPVGGGGSISVMETDQQTYDNMASHDPNTLYVITSLTPSS